MQNSNTIDGSFTTSQIGLSAVPIAEGLLAPLPKFVTLVDAGILNTGLVQASRITSVSSIAADPANLQTGDSTIARSEITVQHIVKRAHLSSPELNLGNTKRHLIGSLARGAAKDILQSATSKITSGGFGAATVAVAEASFSVANLQTLIAACAASPRVALLSSVCFKNVAASLSLGSDNVWRFPGCDAGVFECDLTGDGFAVVSGPEALAGIVARPAAFAAYPQREIEIQAVPLPAIGVTIYSCGWFDLASRSGWISVECLAGFAPAQTGALKYASAP